MKTISGYTVADLVEQTGKTRAAVLTLLSRHNIKPILDEFLYPPEALEVIAAAKRGRPKNPVVEKAETARIEFIKAEKTADLEEMLEKGMVYKNSLHEVMKLLDGPDVLWGEDFKFLVSALKAGSKKRSIISKLIIEKAERARIAFFEAMKNNDERQIAEKRELFIELLIETEKYLLTYPEKYDRFFNGKRELKEEFDKVRNVLYIRRISQLDVETDPAPPRPKKPNKAPKENWEKTEKEEQSNSGEET